MSWAALPVEPACMGKAVGEAGRPPMFVGLADFFKIKKRKDLITFKNIEIK